MVSRVTSDPKQPPRDHDEDHLRRQKTRSIAIACGLVLLVVLFYVATLIHMGDGVMKRPM